MGKVFITRVKAKKQNRMKLQKYPWAKSRQHFMLLIDENLSGHGAWVAQSHGFIWLLVLRGNPHQAPFTWRQLSLELLFPTPIMCQLSLFPVYFSYTKYIYILLFCKSYFGRESPNDIYRHAFIFFSLNSNNIVTEVIDE